jgi:hypothetical protein
LNLTEDNGIHRGEMDILFAVTDSKGKRHPITRHRAKLALSEMTYDRVSRSALRVISELKLPKGHYQIRASAGGAAIAGSVVYDLEIPDYADDFVMSGLALSSSVTGQTPTVSPHDHIDVAFPGPPTTVREFARADRVTLVLGGVREPEEATHGDDDRGVARQEQPRRGHPFHGS